MRDKNLDIFRGTIMIYITCFIHVLYWLGFGHEPYKSYFLIEMPLIFFISGATLTLSKPKKFTAFLVGRFKRVILPYYIWGIISLILTCILYLIIHENISITTLLKDLIFFQENNQIPFCYHIWFIIPYLAIMLLSPLYKRLFLNKPLHIILFTVSALIILFIGDIYTNNKSFIPTQIRNLIAYSSFFILGFTYKKFRISIKTLITGIIIIFSSLVIVYKDLYPTSMQINKFPPNFIFMLYSLGLIFVILYIVSRIKSTKFFNRLKSNKYIQTYNKSGYTIYLYQNWIFLGFSLIIVRLEPYISPLILFPLTVIALFFLHYYVSFITTRIENYIIKIFSH